MLEPTFSEKRIGNHFCAQIFSPDHATNEFIQKLRILLVFWSCNWLPVVFAFVCSSIRTSSDDWIGHFHFMRDRQSDLPLDAE